MKLTFNEFRSRNLTCYRVDDFQDGRNKAINLVSDFLVKQSNFRSAVESHTWSLGIKAGPSRLFLSTLVFPWIGPEKGTFALGLWSIKQLLLTSPLKKIPMA